MQGKRTGGTNQWLALGLFVALCLGVGALGGWATSQSVTTWYVGLTKPEWTPPGWVFGPAWTTLYILMAVSAWRIWRGSNSGDSGWHGPAKRALTLWLVQLALNLCWSFSFFAAQSPALGLVNIVALWLTIAATLAAFFQRDTIAGWLMVPYIAWVSFATALNFAIWQLN